MYSRGATHNNWCIEIFTLKAHSLRWLPLAAALMVLDLDDMDVIYFKTK